MPLKSGYLADWGGRPTVLLWGDSGGMRQLRDCLKAAKTSTETLTLDGFCVAVDGNKIAVRPCSSRGQTGMRLVASGLDWALTPGTADEFAEKVEMLTASKGHQYLDGADDSITVTVSKDEYSPDLDAPMTATTELLQRAFDAPAPKARRMRRKAWLEGMGVMLLLVIFTILASGLVDSNRLLRFTMAAIWVCSAFIFMFWNAVRNNYVPCPRCGWNIFFRKPQPMVALSVPSVCPNCGLDLEHRYIVKDS